MWARSVSLRPVPGQSHAHADANGYSPVTERASTYCVSCGAPLLGRPFCTDCGQAAPPSVAAPSVAADQRHPSGRMAVLLVVLIGIAVIVASALYIRTTRAGDGAGDLADASPMPGVTWVDYNCDGLLSATPCAETPSPVPDTSPPSPVPETSSPAPTPSPTPEEPDPQSEAPLSATAAFICGRSVAQLPDLRPNSFVLGEVEHLQVALATMGFNPGPIDGEYGTQTEEAVKRFQRSTPNLNDDGWVGAFTWTRIQERFCSG